MSHKQRALVLEQALRALMNDLVAFDDGTVTFRNAYDDAAQALDVAGRMTRGVADA